jgi:hypothetical protein
MASVNLPYVKPQRDRAGRLAYWYFRHNGRQWRLPGTPLSEEFMLEYQRLLALTHADTAPENGAIESAATRQAASARWSTTIWARATLSS